MNSRLRKVLSFLILIAILALCFWYINGHKADFASLKIVNPWAIALLVVLMSVSYLCIAIVNRSIVRPFKVELSLHESFALGIITGFYNVITPFRGGMIARAAYLKRKYNFPVTKFLATLSGTYVISFFAASVLGLASLFFLKNTDGHASLIVGAIFACIAIAMGIIMILTPKLQETKNNWFNKIIAVVNGWHTVKQYPRVIAITTIVTILQIVLAAISTYISYVVFGTHLSLSQALFLVCIGTLSIVIQITPAGLGISDAISVFAALAINISPSTSIPVAVLSRVVSFILLFVLGPIYSYFLIKRPERIKS